MSQLNALEHTAIGGVAGCLEALLTHPSVYLKNALQEGRPLSWNPRELYRGVALNVGSIAPLIALQFGSYRAYDTIRQRIWGDDDSMQTKIVLSAMAGATSAVAITPCELIVLHQQKSGRSLWSECKHLLRTYPTSRMFTGLAPMALRESFFTIGYLGLAPNLGHVFANQGFGPQEALVASMLAGGVFNSLVTQPFDTIKTVMQGHLHRPTKYSSMMGATRQLVETRGWGVMYAGLVPRGGRMIFSVFVLNFVGDFLKERWQAFKYPPPSTQQHTVGSATGAAKGSGSLMQAAPAHNS